MQNLLILVSLSFLFFGCKAEQPVFPSGVKSEHQTVLDNKTGILHCFKMNIVSVEPYQVDENPVEVPVTECDGLSGYRGPERVKVLNFVEDSQVWIDKKCP